MILEEIKVDKRKEKNNKIYWRLLFLEMKHRGMQHGDIALYLDVRRETLSVWSNIFLEGDLLYTLDEYAGRRVSPLEPIKEEIRKHAEESDVSILKQ